MPWQNRTNKHQSTRSVFVGTCSKDQPSCLTCRRIQTWNSLPGRLKTTLDAWMTIFKNANYTEPAKNPSDKARFIAWTYLPASWTWGHLWQQPWVSWHTWCLQPAMSKVWLRPRKLFNWTLKGIIPLLFQIEVAEVQIDVVQSQAALGIWHAAIPPREQICSFVLKMLVAVNGPWLGKVAQCILPQTGTGWQRNRIISLCFRLCLDGKSLESSLISQALLMSRLSFKGFTIVTTEISPGTGTGLDFLFPLVWLELPCFEPLALEYVPT